MDHNRLVEESARLMDKLKGVLMKFERAAKRDAPTNRMAWAEWLTHDIGEKTVVPVLV
jgi:hypothetical protein